MKKLFKYVSVTPGPYNRLVTGKSECQTTRFFAESNLYFQEVFIL